jgi:hypothetical protein
MGNNLCPTTTSIRTLGSLTGTLASTSPIYTRSRSPGALAHRSSS